jgi:hypothetical protein
LVPLASRTCCAPPRPSPPLSAKSIGDDAFGECTSLTSINLPISITSIGDDAFEKCASLSSITVPAACSSIGSASFRECTALLRVELPAALKKIGGNAFAKCVSLKEVIMASPLPPSISHSTFKGVVMAACKIIVPKGARNNYRSDKSWNKLPNILEQEQ